MDVDVNISKKNANRYALITELLFEKIPWCETHIIYFIVNNINVIWIFYHRYHDAGDRHHGRLLKKFQPTDIRM